MDLASLQTELANAKGMVEELRAATKKAQLQIRSLEKLMGQAASATAVHPRLSHLRENSPNFEAIVRLAAWLKNDTKKEFDTRDTRAANTFQSDRNWISDNSTRLVQLETLGAIVRCSRIREGGAAIIRYRLSEGALEFLEKQRPTQPPQQES